MAGTLAITRTSLRYGVMKYSLAWISSAGGAVSGSAFPVVAGELMMVKFVPGSGGTQPTDLYDVTLVDTDGVDVLGGVGANLRNIVASFATPLFSGPYFHDATQTLDLVVANAGNAKTGTVQFWIGDPRT